MQTRTHTQPCSVISRENTREITSLNTIITAGLDVFKLGKGLRFSTDTQKREKALVLDISYRLVMSLLSC